MTSKNLMLVLFSASVLMFQSCKKSAVTTTQTVTTQNINATVSKNGSYTYTLPSTAGTQRFKIAAQPAHSATSMITTDVNGNEVYQYTPVANYVGTDAVVVSNVDADQHDCGNHTNMQSKPQATQLKFSLTVADNTTSAKL